MTLSLVSALMVLLTLASHCRALETGTKVPIFALTAQDSTIVEGAVVGDGFLMDQQNITDASPMITTAQTEQTVVHTTVSTQQPKVSEANPLVNFYLPLGAVVESEQPHTAVNPALQDVLLWPTAPMELAALDA